MNWGRVRTVARTDLRQLLLARDFWMPMGILGAIFFFVVPTILLLAITKVGDINAVQQLSNALEVLPQQAQEAIPADLIADLGALGVGCAVLGHWAGSPGDR